MAFGGDLGKRRSPVVAPRDWPTGAAKPDAIGVALRSFRAETAVVLPAVQRALVERSACGAARPHASANVGASRWSVASRSLGGGNVFRVPGEAGSCAPLHRSASPPWLSGNVIGTFVSTVRIGDVLVAGAPGELYPSAREELVRLVDAREIFLLGLAQDHLGDIVHPTEAYASVTALAVPSDNFLFSVSPTLGDHWMCTAHKGARQLGFTVRGRPERCNAWELEPNDFPGEGTP